LQLRVAQAQEAEAISAVINAAFGQAEAFLVDHDRIDVKTVQSLLDAGKFLVADEQGALIGCVYIELRSDRAYLGLLSVDPRRQKAGLGSALMSAAEDYCAKEGCRFMDLRIVKCPPGTAFVLSKPRILRNRHRAL
jgi:predicted N-acetyltransferase YhbS